MKTANRLVERFEKRRAEGRKLLIAYITAGCPSVEASVEIALELDRLGVDAIEYGIPFSDPYGDGAVNVQAAYKALENGCTIERYFEGVQAIRAKSDIPLVAFGYANPVVHSGVERFVERGARSGLDGMLVVDLPVEEAGEIDAACRAHGMVNTFLTAPTSTEERLDRICQTATGFLYHISRTGVTGERADLSPSLPVEIQGLRRRTSIPVVVGFGINTAEQVREVCSFADGVVVGSAIVRRTLSEKPLEQILSDIRELVTPLREAAHG